MTKPSAPLKKKPAPRKPAAPPQAAAAFDKAAPEIDALERDALIPINIDIPRAVSQVLGVLPGLLALRPLIAERLPTHDVGLVDRLETYALAAWYAHLAWLSSGGPQNGLKPLLEEAVPLRANLLGDAEALARRGLVDAETVADIRAGNGHMDTASDLVALSALFSGSWSEIAGKTAATEDEVRRAGELGPELLAALGVREHGAAPGPSDAADKRARAFTLFVNAYDQTRRAVAYLRWNEGDVEAIAPSLYKGRGGRGASSRDTGDAPQENPPAQPDAAPASPDTAAPAAAGAPAAVPPG
ncbi:MULTISPECIES: hypothetical protein [Sorangium]|uniref:Uncharacterized protein n=1 Tax=Sorangium cellulosum TaxID=56 RepID=A0A4P2QLR2_SORCE|nr:MULTISPECIES: hypothetical protein [Sorangium]AUX30768.1 hypothetical protein SOCE836_028810 [Sorangium cellulosum]WCQ90149.1 hypothetical protein NQZ70_02850 [Sorangium sp. Soce836]